MNLYIITHTNELLFEENNSYVSIFTNGISYTFTIRSSLLKKL